MAEPGSALAGVSALVTGGGSGIGLACARRLLVDGATVTLCGRSAERLESAAQSLKGDTPDGAAVRTSVCDVADEDQVRQAVDVASQGFDGLSIAVAAAGTGSAGPLLSLTPEMWKSVLDVNLIGAFLTLKHAASSMARRGSGSFVAVSSIAGPLTHRLMAPYSVSKAALEALVRNAADELGSQGIRANAVRPGLVPTDLSAGLVNSDGIQADYLDQMPIRRLGTVEDIAEGVRYLAGPESGWVTGQLLAIDGGHTLRRGPDIAAGMRSRPARQ